MESTQEQPTTSQPKTTVESAVDSIEGEEVETKVETNVEEKKEEEKEEEEVLLDGPEEDGILGIDFGTSKVTVSIIYRSNEYPAIVRNDISDLSTTNVISFNGRERLIGENAVARVIAAPNATIVGVSSLLGVGEAGVKEALPAIDCGVDESGNVVLKIPYAGATSTFTPTQIAAMIFKRIQAYVKESEKKEILSCVLSYPPALTSEQVKELHTAAAIAGYNVLAAVPDYLCLSACWLIKHPLEEVEQEGVPATPEAKEGETPEETPATPEKEKVNKKVVFVNIGSTFTSVTLTTFEPQTISESQSDDLRFGGQDVDQRIFDFACKSIIAKGKADPSQNNRNRSRLLKASTKTKLLLSTTDRATVTLTTPDEDIVVPLTVAEMETACASEKVALKQFLVSFKKKIESEGAIDAVEVVGGGARVPFALKLIGEVFECKTSHTLDSSSSVSIGAALLGASKYTSYEVSKKLKAPSVGEVDGEAVVGDVSELVALEEEMVVRDTEVRQLGLTINELESLLFSLKDNLNDPKFKDFVEEEKKEDFASLVRKVEFWLEDQEGDEDVTLSEFEEKKKTLLTEGEALQPKLFERRQEIAKEKAKNEAEAAMKSALAGLASSSKKKDKEPKSNKQKLAAAEEKKKSGNSHFVNLDYPSAVQRYTQGLEYLLKMYDTPADLKPEVDALKLSFYLNLAMCFLKVVPREPLTMQLRHSRSTVKISKVSSAAPRRMSKRRSMLLPRKI
eukprot:TRINITY_DN1817_c0_g1_i3.p1 TRINITY_DN1817_c0_g1~~TRINITY_DN1817_c0_g1_i3.p1  ORF type:complete len:736 (-),score=246.12 TRINITY_DN1817_c0_g1_i3:2365-4572(-)